MSLFGTEERVDLKPLVLKNFDLDLFKRVLDLKNLHIMQLRNFGGLF